MRPWLKCIVALIAALMVAPLHGWCCGPSGSLDAKAAPQALVKSSHGCCHSEKGTTSHRLPATPTMCHCCPDLNLAPSGVRPEASQASTPLWLTVALDQPQTFGGRFETILIDPGPRLHLLQCVWRN